MEIGRSIKIGGDMLQCDSPSSLSVPVPPRSTAAAANWISSKEAISKPSGREIMPCATADDGSGWLSNALATELSGARESKVASFEVGQVEQVPSCG